MGFLDEMLTFERSFREGQVVEVPQRRRTVLEWLNSEQIGAPEHRVHYTKAGLPVILPHDNYGGLYFSPDHERKPFRTPGNNKLIDQGFSLRQIQEINGIFDIVLESSLVGYRDFIVEELGSEGTAVIGLDYELDRRGTLMSASISYQIGFNFQVGFTVEKKGEGVATLVHFNHPLPYRMSQFEKKINYEESLRNLVLLIKSDDSEKSKRSLGSLRSLDYLS